MTNQLKTDTNRETVLDVNGSATSRLRVRDFWPCAALSLACVTGCSSWDQFAQNATQPLRSTGNLLARTGDQVGDMFESHSTKGRNPDNLPAHQGLRPSVARQDAPPKVPMTSGATPAAATLPTASQPKAMQAIHSTPNAAEKLPETLTVPKTATGVELLPAPPAELQPISHSRPAPTVVAATPLAISTWCRVRIRNIGQQATPQVAVTVHSPEGASLVSKEGNAVSAPTPGKMEFAPVPQVGAGEEVILLIGLVQGEPRGQRLRVQVRDGLGGSNHDVQARWQVAIEAAE